MNDRGSVFARRFVFILLALLLCAGVAAAEGTVTLGEPFPEFTAEDTEGNAFALSEALKDHEAVLVNIWATWCPPCRMEMPFLNEAYDRYRDRVAFIALSSEEEDTLEKIEAYRQEMGLRFPMGRDEGGALGKVIGNSGIPAMVVVDRFGNAVFSHEGSFLGTGEITRVLDAFLGDGYTESTVLDEIPRDTSTRAFPVGAKRMIHVENEGAKCFLFSAPEDPIPQPVYVVEDDVAHLRLELAASDDPGAVTYYNLSEITLFAELLDAERNACVVDQPMPDAESETFYAYGCLTTGDSEDSDLYGIYLIPGEEYLDPLAEEMRSWGYDVTWESANAAGEAQDAAQAYTVHVVDQDGGPVPGAMVNFCTDTACTMVKSDESGTITFDGEPDTYHIQMLKVPEGYGFDADFELYIGPAYGEWLLRIRRDAAGEAEDPAALGE